MHLTSTPLLYNIKKATGGQLKKVSSRCSRHQFTESNIRVLFMVIGGSMATGNIFMLAHNRSEGSVCMRVRMGQAP